MDCERPLFRTSYPWALQFRLLFFFRTITHQRESVNEYDKIWVATTTVTRVLGKSLSVLAKVIGDGCEDLFNNLKNIEK